MKWEIYGIAEPGTASPPSRGAWIEISDSRKMVLKPIKVAPLRAHSIRKCAPMRCL